ncbi:DUF3072 domain-containing protein [Limimaricola pyoseonensis]|uniref:DUF3072 domain-containing protein n=1 Tax=Limimaricola pyoseonensis TaxID=521013 RepID=A0A1G7GBH4_9RHOB|nr:DUF3072 domain-containing protein [Limimaricola pyoseonensis]SDE85504.1 Protein of unknown function [Limimaricola pyoseonensis]
MMPPNKGVLPETEARTAENPDAPMTEEQAAELRQLCERTGEEFDTSLTEAQAVERIDALRAQADK